MKILYKLFRLIKNTKHIEYILLSLLLITGFLVRLYKINSPIADWHSFRQADTASVSRIYSEGKINSLLPKYHDISRIQSGLFNPNGYRFVEFPVFNIFHTLLFKGIGYFSLEVWGRLVSIFSALISAYLLFNLGKRYISKIGGLISAAFYLLLPYNIYFTRVILPEPMAIMFALWALWFFTKFIDLKKDKYLYVSSILFATSLLIKPYTIFYGLPLLALTLEQYSFKKILTQKKFILSALLVLIPFFSWRLWMSQFPEGIPFWKWTFNGDGIRFRPAFWYWIFGERLTKLILGYLGLVPFFAGIISYEKKNKFIHYFILGMFLFTAIVATANVKHDYYQSITIPAISLVYSLGVIRLWKTREFNQKILRGAILFSAGIMLLMGAYQVKEYYKINHPEIIEAGKAVDRLTPKDSLIIAAYNGDTAFLYQTKRKGWPNVELPINELIEEGAQYYVTVNLNDSQAQRFMKEFKILELTPTYVVLDLKNKQ